MRRLPSFIVIAVAAAACVTAGDGGLEGRLVVVERDGAIVTFQPDGTDRVMIDDASTTHFQPQWSPLTNRLAWGQETSEGFALTIVDGDGANRIETSTSGLPYYIHWAPDGDRLVALYNGAGGVEARYVDATSGETEVLGSAIPYFFSWSPDSTQIVANRDGESLDVVDMDGSVTRLEAGSLSYQAPAWTPSGIFHVTDNGVSKNDDGVTSVVARVPAPVLFVANRSGTRIAIQGISAQSGNLEVSLQTAPDLTPNLVNVVNTASLEVSRATEAPAVGLFWSPDGESLAMLLPDGTTGRLRWVVWREGATVELATFTPRPDFVQGVLAFAAQYAQSLGVWSPDSRAVVFVGTIEGESGVWTQKVDGSDPTLVTDGIWASWSQP